MKLPLSLLIIAVFIATAAVADVTVTNELQVPIKFTEYWIGPTAAGTEASAIIYPGDTKKIEGDVWNIKIRYVVDRIYGKELVRTLDVKENRMGNDSVIIRMGQDKKVKLAR